MTSTWVQEISLAGTIPNMELRHPAEELEKDDWLFLLPLPDEPASAPEPEPVNGSSKQKS